MRLLNFFITTSLRSITLLIKFFFSIFLAKELTLGDFGNWILIISLINYLVLLCGFEFYNLTLRDYFQKKDFSSIKKIVYQWTIHIRFYLFLFVLYFLIFFLINDRLLIFSLILILVFEHITTEFYRISCFYGHVLFSNFILFLKSGFWMIIFYGLFILNHEIKIEMLVLYWNFGLIVTFIFCAIKYFNFVKSIWLVYKKDPKIKIHINKRKFFKTLQPFLILALCLRAPFVFDKLLISYFNSPQDLAIYGYYWNFANGIQSLFEAFFIVSILPVIINLKNKDEANKVIIQTVNRALIFWIFASFIIFILLPQFDKYIDKSFSNSTLLFLTIMLSQFIFSISVIYQYVLYSFRLDLSISKGAVIFFILSLILFLVLIPMYSSIGASLAIIISCSTLLIIRIIQITKYNDR